MEILDIDRNGRAGVTDTAGEISDLVALLEGSVYGQPNESHALARAALLAATSQDFSKVLNTRLAAASSPARELQANSNLILEGVAGIGKTHVIDSLTSELANAFHWHAVHCKLLDLRDVDANSADYAERVRNTLQQNKVDGVADVIVLHPGSSYEELVLGLRPTAGNKFAWHAGPLLRAILGAAAAFARGCDAPRLLVLDEINRCNLPSVLGELMLLIDPSRRLSRKEFESLNSLKGKEDQEQLIRRGKALRLSHLKGALLGHLGHEKESGQGHGQGSGGDKGDSDKEPEECGHDLVWIPDNLFILGTMNSSDRSILGFDQALRRRFPPLRLDPHTVQEWKNVLRQKCSNYELSEPACNIAASEITALAAVNVLLRARIGPDAMIGHSYIYEALAECGSAADEKTTKDAFARAWEFGILPQVIHAAESARELEFVEQMMKPIDGEQAHPVVNNESAQYSDNTGNSDRLGECIRTISGENDLSAKVANFRQAMASGAIGASRSCERTLTLVGRGHGKRLLIVNRTSPWSADATGLWRQVFPFDAEKPCEKAAAASAIDTGGPAAEANDEPK